MNSDFDYINISEGEAARILTTCWPLVYVLNAQGYKTELDEKNQLRLYNFNRLRLAGWFENSLIQQTAGMTRSEIVLLNAALEYYRTNREPLDPSEV